MCERASSNLCRSLVTVSTNPGKYSWSCFTWLNNLWGTCQSWQERQPVWRVIFPIETLLGHVSKSLIWMLTAQTMSIYIKQNKAHTLILLFPSSGINTSRQCTIKLKYPKNLFNSDWALPEPYCAVALSAVLHVLFINTIRGLGLIPYQVLVRLVFSATYRNNV